MNCILFEDLWVAHEAVCWWLIIYDQTFQGMLTFIVQFVPGKNTWNALFHAVFSLATRSTLCALICMWGVWHLLFWNASTMQHMALNCIWFYTRLQKTSTLYFDFLRHLKWLGVNMSPRRQVSLTTEKHLHIGSFRQVLEGKRSSYDSF